MADGCEAVFASRRAVFHIFFQNFQMPGGGSPAPLMELGGKSAPLNRGMQLFLLKV
jgi:hypothetical protein